MKRKRGERGREGMKRKRGDREGEGKGGEFRGRGDKRQGEGKG